MKHAGFLKVAAMASWLSVITTCMLIFLPELFATGQGFEARMARVHEPAYILRSWAYLLHPFVVLTAALGLMYVERERSPVLALLGIMGFTWWALLEASQQTLTLFAFDKWRLAYDTADEATRAALRINTVMYDGIWDGLYALLLIAFTIGNACFAASMVRQPGLSRVVSGFMIAVCFLSLCLLANEMRFPLLPDAVLGWAYPVIQPLGRFLIGLWLWRASQAAVVR
jgi:hypothetical protein